MRDNKTNRKTDRRTVYTRNVIKDAFKELLHKRKWNKITVKEICERAEIGRATFYLHYLDIRDVFEDILDDVLDEQMQVFQSAKNFVKCFEITNQAVPEMYNDSETMFLFSCGIDYPPFLEKVCRKVTEHAISVIQDDSVLGPNETETLLFSLYYGYISFMNYLIQKHSIEALENYRNQFNQFILIPFYKELFPSIQTDAE